MNQIFSIEVVGYYQLVVSDFLKKFGIYNGNTTTYTYNNLNQLTKQTYKDGKEIVYTYDKAGNLTSKTDANGSITTNTYDNLNRLVSKNISTGTGVLGVTSETYTYDQVGRLIEANDSNNHKLNFNYDNLNRLTSENQSGSLVGYTYDDNNNLLSITNPNGKVTAYTYDELDRVTNIGFSGSLIASYTYTGILNDSLNYGNGINVLKTYDDLNRLNSLNNGVKSYNYTYDDVSNITSDSHKNFTYDDIYRLTQVNESLSGSLLENYDFDDVGNRLDDGNNSYVSNDLNQYTSLSGAVSKSLVYDNNGNLISDGEKNFLYDYKNRLVKVTNLSGTGIIAEFSYDVLGRRYEKKSGLEITKYVYSNENIILEYKTSNGITLKKEYINGLGTDNLIAVEQDENSLTISEREELSFCNDRVLGYTGSFIQYGWNAIVDRCENLSLSGGIITTNRYYFSKDNLGSVIGITDNSGSLVASYDYDSYGNFSLSGSDIGNDRLYTGREFDSEIGLYYYRARYYDSSLGRFISRDPIDIADNVNLYSYVGNNPVNYTDPTGLKHKEFLVNNEGNAWFFDEVTFNNPSGHAGLYFIYGGKDYLLSYYPKDSPYPGSFQENDIFFSSQPGQNVPGIYNDEIDKIRKQLMGESEKDENKYYIEIGKENINTKKLYEWYNNEVQNIPKYNAFVNNCSDEVEKGLEAGEFFQYTEFKGIPTPVPGNFPRPGTTPIGLRYDVHLELFYKNLLQ